MSGTYQAVPPQFPAPARGSMVWYYAGFWWRVLAWLVDSVILTVAGGLIRMATGLRQFGVTFGPSIDGTQNGPVSNVAYQVNVFHAQQWHTHGGWMSLVSLLMTIAYFSLLESSRWQATLGKRVCGLRVTDLAGQRIGLARAIGRYLGKFVSAALLGIGFLMVAWTRRKQALHDMMAGTLVMRLREADPVFAFQSPPR